MLKVIQCNIHSLYLLLVLSSLAFISGSILSSSTVSADDSVVDKVKITVPTSCSMTGTGMNTHNAEIINGNYVQNIGTTTLHTFCNDNNGFAIYAAGYTGNEIGKTNSNKLVGTNATNNLTIDTGLATSAGNPDVSNWAMKLAITQDSGDTTGTNAFTIDSAPNTSGGANASFTQYHVVPNKYTKVAHKNSATDMTTTTGGVKLTTTYAAYISRTQPADTYTGQVIYTLVHPSDHATPVANPAILDTGKTVNSKLKSLAATVVNGEETTITPDFDNRYGDWGATDSYIKSIDVHLETPAPAGFTPSEKNTISTLDSRKPIYAIFDNTDDAGIMHFYTEGEQIFLSPDSSFMFSMFFELADLSDISDWDTSNVTDMSNMFQYVGENVSALTLLDLSSWDTSRVTDMSYMFYATTNVASTWSIVGLSNWDTSSVTNMEQMFTVAGRQADSFILDLSSWDVSNVTTMRNMFENAGDIGSQGAFYLDLSSWDTSSVTDMSWMLETAGGNHRNWTIKGLSDWDTSNVTNMSGMFSSAGRCATTFSLDLSSWNTSNVTDMSYMFSSAGHDATTWSIGNLSSWNTSNVTNMSNMFQYANGDRNTTSFIIDLTSWNTSSVTKMDYMFDGAGRYATTWSIGDLSSWDTSNVTSTIYMFQNAGVVTKTWSIGDLSSWNTSSLTSMYYMFSNAGSNSTTFSLNLSSWDTSGVSDMMNVFSGAGSNSTTFSLNLSSWDTSKVTRMVYMFKDAGWRATTFALNLSSWDTSSVKSMTGMFDSTGSSATTWSVTIPPTNGNGINNTTSRLYGKTSSTYIAPPSGKSFTLAQP